MLSPRLQSGSLRAAALCIALLAAAASARAAEPSVAFTVNPGDTMIGLSNSVLVSAAAWREVAALNRLRNSNRIAPGQVLVIPQRLLRWQAPSLPLARG